MPNKKSAVPAVGRRTARTALLAAVMGTLWIGCDGGPAEPDPDPTDPQVVDLVVTLELAGTSVVTVTAEVDAPDVGWASVDTIQVSNDTALGPLAVPEGADRVVTFRAYDGAGTETHRGSETLTLTAQQLPAPVDLTLEPRTGGPSITGVLAAFRILLATTNPGFLRVGESRPAEAAVVDPAGDTLATSVSWMSLDPGIATVDDEGVVTGVGGGETRITASHGGLTEGFSVYVLDGAALVRGYLRTTYATWFDGSYGYDGPGPFLSAASFQHSTPWANSGMVANSQIPRVALVNDPADPYYRALELPWLRSYIALDAILSARQELEHPATAAQFAADERSAARAFLSFVEGLAYATLAVLYDRAAIVDGTTDPALVDYGTVMDTALARFDAAAAVADTGMFTVPGDWIPVQAGVPAAELGRAARSMKARYRAAVARTPAERAALDWSSVIADVDAGLMEDWVMDMDPASDLENGVLIVTGSPQWAMDPYFLTGMADQSGSYQRWLSIPLAERVPDPDSDSDGSPDPILAVTPDTRFAQGTTVAEQQANPGSQFVIPTTWDIREIWDRPSRGTWRWSYYWHTETEPYALDTDHQWPEMTAAELQLLKAEGLYRAGDAGGAAAIVNQTRTAAGLDATDAAGSNTDCVPKLPDGSCGDLWEMIKWEKRMETRMKGLFGAPWFFDSRGWGDLYVDTFLHLPIPCQSLRTLGEACYTFGGDHPMSAAVSTYAWPGES